MRKYGKYEKRPEKAKKPEAKSAILQTYFTSLLCLVLCVSMFFGTSFAWFTSEVNNVGNEIYIGTLDVDLRLKQVEVKSDIKHVNWVSLKKTDAPRIFTNAVKWEPGYTALETLQVVNQGDLTFDYELKFISEDTTLDMDAASMFEVYVIEVAKDTEVKPANIGEIKAENSGWNYVGDLDKILAEGIPVFAGEMITVGEKVPATTEAAAEENEDNAAAGVAETEKQWNEDGTDTYIIALHMKEEATGNVGDKSIMGKSIKLNVKLIAYQKAYEKDGFDNSYYDKGAQSIATVEELLDAINNAKDGDVITVAAGTYDLTENPLVVNKAIVLQGADPANKPEFKFWTGNAENGETKIYHGIEIKSSNVTLKNLKLAVDPAGPSTGNTVQISANGNEYYSDIIIDSCEFYGSDHCVALYGNNVTIQNCILDESTADSQGNIIYVWGTSGKLTIRNNQFVGNNQRKHGISFYYQSAASAISGDILIEGNIFENLYKGIVHEGSMAYTDVNVQILNNTFTNCLKKPVAIDNGTFTTYLVNGNIFKNIVTTNDPLIDNGANAMVNANGNYWGSETPVWTTVVNSANVTVENYYADEEKTDLRTK